MRTFAVIFAVALLTVVAASTSSVADEVVGVRYSWDGPNGTLEFLNGDGLQFKAFSSSWVPMSKAAVVGDYFAAPCMNTGPDATGVVLHVQLSNGSILSIDRPDWEWDDL